MASVENLKPLVCGVCLENKEKRTPKALPCLHSFCLKCLEDWHTKRQSKGLDDKKWIECPLCRQRANIPKGGISAFPLDFKVQQFSDYVQAQLNCLSCKKCSNRGLSQIATTLCKTCNRLFCEKCSAEHLKTVLFTGHEIVHNFCKVHGASFDYMCVTCFAGVCVDCVHSDIHKGHEITNVEAGLAKSKTKLEHMNSELKDGITGYNKEIYSRLQLCVEKQCESGNNMKRIGELIKGKIDQIVKTAIERHHTEHKEVLSENFAPYSVKREWMDAVISEIDYVFQGMTEDVLQKLQESSNSIHESLDSIKEAHVTLPDPDLLSTDCCRLDAIEKIMNELDKCTLVCGLSSALSKTHDSPVLKYVREVECNKENGLDSPWNGNATVSGDIIVCNCEGGVAHKVLRDGSIQVLPGTNNVFASCLYGTDIYFVGRNGKELLKLSKECAPQTLYLDSTLPRSHGLATDGKNVFISNNKNIVLYSLSENTCKSIIKHNSANSITCMRVHDSTVLVVAEREGHKVVFYDQTGKELNRFGKHGTGNGEMKQPCGVKKAVNGNIYVADWGNHRITEYNPDGTFVRNVLTKDDGLHFPCDIALRFPYLWVIECVHREGTYKKSVKLFQFM